MSRLVARGCLAVELSIREQQPRYNVFSAGAGARAPVGARS